jgi:hypothetical protein
VYNSILQFNEQCSEKLEKIVNLILKGEADFDMLTEAVQQEVLKLGTGIVKEVMEKTDELIKESIERKKIYTVEKNNEPKQILDVMGSITYSRTGYTDKKTGDYIYLVDRIMGICPHQRLTLAAAARTIEEAAQTSYSKGGKNASITDSTSKQAVKELIHKIEINPIHEELIEKKKIRRLHVVADEDHVSAQFWEKRGDLETDTLGRKQNTIMPKIICLYEDIIDIAKENSGNHRNKLTGKHYFGGVYEGTTKNEELWQEVQDYIDDVYDEETLEKVYIAGDGAGWIKSGVNVVDKSVFVLDKFHMMKYINKATVHLWDSVEDAKELIWDAINNADKEALKDVTIKILNVTEEEKKAKEVKRMYSYLTNNWEGIKIRSTDKGGCWPCCAEAQVSHVLSKRMSSRPMGWSKHGCNQITKLRIYMCNGGKVIDLLKKQQEELLKTTQEKIQKIAVKTLKIKQKTYRNINTLNVNVPGIDDSSMDWLRGIINGGFNLGNI